MRARFLVSVGALFALACATVAVGCAKGGAASTTGGGGAGGDSTGVTGPTSTSTSTASSTSSGACGEMPCGLAPQCGCDNNLGCSVTSKGNRVCEMTGSVAWGDACVSANDCVAGTICLPVGANLAGCSKFCASDADCKSPGGLCTLGIADENKMVIPNAHVCSTDCDPLSSAGCSIGGSACQILQEPMGQQRWYTQCYEAGTKTQGDACTLITDCALGYSCFTVGNAQQCLKLCDVAGSACPAATKCDAIKGANMIPMQIGNTQYGACL
jgi:hypothetical protein